MRFGLVFGLACISVTLEVEVLPSWISQSGGYTPKRDKVMPLNNTRTSDAFRFSLLEDPQQPSNDTNSPKNLQSFNVTTPTREVQPPAPLNQITENGYGKQNDGYKTQDYDSKSIEDTSILPRDIPRLTSSHHKPRKTGNMVLDEGHVHQNYSSTFQPDVTHPPPPLHDTNSPPINVDSHYATLPPREEQSVIHHITITQPHQKRKNDVSFGKKYGEKTQNYDFKPLNLQLRIGHTHRKPKIKQSRHRSVDVTTAKYRKPAEVHSHQHLLRARTLKLRSNIPVCPPPAPVCPFATFAFCEWSSNDHAVWDCHYWVDRLMDIRSRNRAFAYDGNEQQNNYSGIENWMKLD